MLMSACSFYSVCTSQFPAMKGLNVSLTVDVMTLILATGPELCTKSTLEGLRPEHICTLL